jgi:hypothetical protein
MQIPMLALLSLGVNRFRKADNTRCAGDKTGKMLNVWADFVFVTVLMNGSVRKRAWFLWANW